MVRLADLTTIEADAMRGMPADPLPGSPYVSGPPLNQRRVAILTTAGLHQRDQPNFFAGDSTYRVIPGDVSGNDLVMSQVSVSFDRTGFQQDVNVVFPIDRLREMVDAGEIGSVADNHYSMMAAFIDFDESAKSAREIAGYLKKDGVDAVMLTPV
jgi:D-proline reductase (dithiol) PrdB